MAISRYVLVIGALVAFTVLVYSEMGVPGGPPSISVPGFPAFVNPFDTGPAQFSNYHWLPVDGPYPGATAKTVGTNEGCSDSTYWNCIEDVNGPDQSATYIRTVAANVDDFRARLGGQFDQGELYSFTATVWCQTTASATGGPLFFFIGVDQEIGGNPNSTRSGWGGYGGPCPMSQFSPITVHSRDNLQFTFDSNPVLLTIGTAFANQDVAAPSAKGNMSFSTVAIDATFTQPSGGTAGCSGIDFFSNVACVLSGFFGFVYKAALFGINVVIYIASWFIFTAQLLAGFILVIAWFYAIPGLPQALQAFIDAALTAMIFSILIQVAGLVRGGSGAV